MYVRRGGEGGKVSAERINLGWEQCTEQGWDMCELARGRDWGEGLCNGVQRRARAVREKGASLECEDADWKVERSRRALSSVTLSLCCRRG